MPPFRLGLAGTAHWATTVHGAAAVAAPDVELAGVWGRDAGRTKDAAERLDCPAYTDFDTLLGDVDGVAFAVPPDVQAPLARRAAAAGRHLLLEKPVALTVAGADALAEAVETAGVATVWFVTRRWIPETAAWLDGLRARGGWESGRVELLAAVPPALLGGSSWRVAHGALWDVGPHALSVLEAVLGPVTEVAGLAGVRDTVHLVLRHDSGGTSSAELTLTATPEAAGERFEFRAAHGRSGPPAPDRLAPEHNAAAAARALGTLVRRAAGDRGAAVPDAAYGAHVTHVLAAAEAALRSGTTEHVR